MANSGFMAIADYSHVDSKNNLLSSGSIRNRLYIASDTWFTCLFLFEFIVKVVGLGFIGEHPAYLSDWWNWLDICVVIGG